MILSGAYFLAIEHLKPSRHDVRVPPVEKHRVACWIDLCVPSMVADLGRRLYNAGGSKRST